MACDLIQLLDMSLLLADITNQLSFLSSSGERFPLELPSLRATEPLKCSLSLRCAANIRHIGDFEDVT